MKIKKQGALILRVKMRNTELYLKGAAKELHLFTACSRLQQDYPNWRQSWTASTGSTPSKGEYHGKFSTDHSSSERNC